MNKSPIQPDAPKNKPAKRVILLEDLDGAEDDVIGGAGQKLFFGETATPMTDFPGLMGGK